MTSPQIAPQYTPAPHILNRSLLNASDLISHFQGSPGSYLSCLLLLCLLHFNSMLTSYPTDFYTSLEYISCAPALVFDRVVGNVSTETPYQLRHV